MKQDEARAVAKLYHQHHHLARTIYAYGQGEYGVVVSRNGEEILVLSRRAALMHLGYHFTAEVDIT
jgi:hypothetical protein